MCVFVFMFCLSISYIQGLHGNHIWPHEVEGIKHLALSAEPAALLMLTAVLAISAPPVVLQRC